MHIKKCIHKNFYTTFFASTGEIFISRGANREIRPRQKKENWRLKEDINSSFYSNKLS